jgi:hypothetical protein
VEKSGLLPFPSPLFPIQKRFLHIKSLIQGFEIIGLQNRLTLCFNFFRFFKGQFVLLAGVIVAKATIGDFLCFAAFFDPVGAIFDGGAAGAFHFGGWEEAVTPPQFKPDLRRFFQHFFVVIDRSDVSETVITIIAAARQVEHG